MKRLLSCGLLALAPWFASASVVTGDTVTFTANPGVFGPVAALVGAGTDLTAGVFQFDFDAGAGDTFSWISSPAAGDLAGSTSITISDLDFTDGSSLVGFVLDSTLLSGVSISTTADSLTISYTSGGFVGPGTLISGRYVTRAEVPVPATLPLVLAGLGLLGFSVRRRSQAA
jgi:hypothetical protein